MLKGELEDWRAVVLAEGERWARALDADDPQRGDIGRSRDDLRRALGFPTGCFSTQVPGSSDDEEPVGEVERYAIIGYEVPSLNRVRHTHWSRKKREKTMLRMQLVEQMKTASGHRGRYGRRMPDPVPRRCHLRVYRRVIIGVDEDNLIGGCKALIDCIEAVGLIWEDSPLWFRPSFQFLKCDPKRGPGVELELWDIPNTIWTDAQQHVVARATEPAWVRKDRSRAQQKLAGLRRGHADPTAEG